jgi:hypothetical protein
MRPATLAEAVERVRSGASRDIALAEYLDTFYLAPSAERRFATLAEKPALTGDVRLDAFVGAMADYLARQYRLPRVPDWAFAPERFLDRPWHVSPFDSDEMREFLTFSSPAEFSSRNIFTEERPLRRVRAGLQKVSRSAASTEQA